MAKNRSKGAMKRSSQKQKVDAEIDATDDSIQEVNKRPSVHKSHFDIKFLFSRGASTLFLLIPHSRALTDVHHDMFAKYSILLIMLCSLAWNNFAFAWPQSVHPSVLNIPRHFVLFASTLDGFGMVAASLVIISYTLRLGIYFWKPWAIGAVYSLYEHILVVNSQGDHTPKFIGQSGGVVLKVHYPFQVHVIRSTFVGFSVLCAGYELYLEGEYMSLTIMMTALLIGYATYLTCGFDKDFTLPNVWIWHGCCAVFAYYQVGILANISKRCMESFGIDIDIENCV